MQNSAWAKFFTIELVSGYVWCLYCIVFSQNLVTSSVLFVRFFVELECVFLCVDGHRNEKLWDYAFKFSLLSFLWFFCQSHFMFISLEKSIRTQYTVRIRLVLVNHWAHVQIVRIVRKYSHSRQNATHFNLIFAFHVVDEFIEKSKNKVSRP